MAENTPPEPPQINPYIFPVLLAGFGLWCLYDGFLSPNPDMQKHLTFNRIASVVLLLWAAIDFVRTRKREKAGQESETSEDSGPGAN